MHYTDLKELRKDLAKLNGNLEEWAIEVLLENAQLIQGIAKSLVRVRSGALRNSIRIVRQGNTVKVTAGGAAAPYAAVIEIRYPFLRPAYDMVEPHIPDQLKMKVTSKLGK